MDDLSLRVYLENAADADRGGWLELPVAPERLDAFMRGVVGVAEGDGYVVADHEPGWFGDVLGSGLEAFSVSSLNQMARAVEHARDLAVADGVDGDVFLDMLATGAESEGLRMPHELAMLAMRTDGLAGEWTSYSLPGSWRAGNSTPDELYGASVAYGLMGADVFSRLSYCMDLKALGRDESANAGVTAGASGYVTDHEPLVPSGRLDDESRAALKTFADGWKPPSANVFGVDVLSALEDTLRRIRSARAGMGDFDEVAREVMGVEQFRPEMHDDDYGSVALDLGYVLPSPMASFSPRPAAASAPECADPTMAACETSSASRSM